MSGPKQYKASIETLEGYASMGYRVDAIGEQQQFFQVIEVDGNKLIYKAYSADGVLFDKAVISKDPETGLKHLE